MEGANENAFRSYSVAIWQTEAPTSFKDLGVSCSGQTRAWSTAQNKGTLTDHQELQQTSLQTIGLHWFGDFSQSTISNEDQFLPVPQFAPFTTWTAESTLADNKQTHLRAGLDRTPQPDVPTPKDLQLNKSFGRVAPRLLVLRDNPIPRLDWADSSETFLHMCYAEETYTRNPDLLSRHPDLQPHVRSILFDWMREVCEVFKLQRESYHLAVEYTNRYLAHSSDVPRSGLQLVGATALWVAAKLEENFPPAPALLTLCNVTDQNENQMIDMERVLLQTLEYNLCPVTCNAWLLCYMQIANYKQGDRQPTCGFLQNSCPAASNGKRKQNFEIPNFEKNYFVQIAELVDLCLMDLGSLRYPPSVITAAACFHLMEPSDIALKISGYSYPDLMPCLRWMNRFADAMRARGEAHWKHFDSVPSHDLHNIQTHSFDYELYEFCVTNGWSSQPNQWSGIVDDKIRAKRHCTNQPAAMPSHQRLDNAAGETGGRQAVPMECDVDIQW